MYVSAGTFGSAAEARAMANALDGLGAVEIVPASGGLAGVVVRPDGRTSIDHDPSGCLGRGRRRRDDGPQLTVNLT